MVQDISPKAHASGLLDMFLLGLAKAGTEKVLTPFVGNGNLVSGIVKTVGGSAVYSFVDNKVGHTLGGGMAIDGVEDIIQSLLGGFLGGATSADSDGGW